MKIKNPYIALLAVFMLSIGIYSCRKELVNIPEIKPEAQWARDYFKQSLIPNEGNKVDAYQYVENVLKANLMSNKKENYKIPIWQKAIQGKTNLYEFIEVPLKYTSKVTPMLYVNEKGKNNVKTADKELLRASLDRLIIYKNNKGQIDQRIISFIPTEQYLQRHNGDISHNRIDKLDKDFEGTLIYRKWNGTFLFALVIKEGKAIRKISLDKRQMKFTKTAFRGMGCVDIDLYEWFQDCEYIADNPVPVWCGEPYSEYVGTFEFCYPTEDEDPCLDPANFNTVECGGGGDDGSEVVEEDEGWGLPGSANFADEEITTTTLENDGRETINKYVTATIYTAVKNEYVAKFVTHEKITLWRIPYIGKWQYDDITHLNINTVGTLGDITIEPVVNYTTGSINNAYLDPYRSINAHAKMKYSFHDKRTRTINGQAYTKTYPEKNLERWWNSFVLGIPISEM